MESSPVIVTFEEPDERSGSEERTRQENGEETHYFSVSVSEEGISCQQRDTKEDEKSSFQIIADACTINLLTPCENLPRIAPGELNVIGRWITFEAQYSINSDDHNNSHPNVNCRRSGGVEQDADSGAHRELNSGHPQEGSENRERTTMHFGGLVSAITAETISLVCVTRYSEKSFAELERLKKLRDELAAAGRRHPSNYLSEEVIEGDVTVVELPDSYQLSHQCSNGIEQGTEQGFSENQVWRTSNGLQHSGELAENSLPFPLSSENSINNCTHPTSGVEEMISTHNCTLSCNALSGYLHQLLLSKKYLRKKLTAGDEDYVAPFMTFSRKKIHNVQYGIDPPSTFYTLLHSSGNSFIEMQCLRLFVRRYLVLTSQGCNPHQIPLQSFILRCCNYSHIDDTLLLRLAKEELINLLEVQAEIERLAASILPRRMAHSGGLGGIEQQDVEAVLWRQHMEELVNGMRKYLALTLLVYLTGLLSSLLALFLFSDVKVIKDYLESYERTYNFFFFTLLIGFMITRVHLAVTLPHFFLRLICPLFLILQIVISTLVYMSTVSLFFSALTSLPIRKLESYLLREVSTSDLLLTYQSLRCSGFLTSCNALLNHLSIFQSSVGMEITSQLSRTSFLEEVLSSTTNASNTFDDDTSSIYAMLWCPANMTVVYSRPCAPRLMYEVRRMTYPFILLSIAMIVFLLKSFWVFRSFFIGRVWLLA